MSNFTFQFNQNKHYEKVQLVYAEVMNGITLSMLEDKQVAIIYDNGTFLVTTEENSLKYNEEFYPVGAEAQKEYNLEFKDGCLKGSNF